MSTLEKAEKGETSILQFLLAVLPFKNGITPISFLVLGLQTLTYPLMDQWQGIPVSQRQPWIDPKKEKSNFKFEMIFGIGLHVKLILLAGF